MIVDGKAIAENIYRELKDEVKTLPHTPRLSVITCAPNFETQKYLNLKKRKAEEVDITLNIVELAYEVATDEFVQCIQAVAAASDGVVVQLPIPKHIDREAILATLPADKDPDGLSEGKGRKNCVSPVVIAIDEISKKHEVSWDGKRVVVLGQGKLVGAPAAAYARSNGAQVHVITEETEDATDLVKNADIIVAGIGHVHIITPGMVKEGVIVFDAGTSEDGGELRGDVHPDVAHKSALFTPVPGGIGPITVAGLLRNLVELAKRQ